MISANTEDCEIKIKYDGTRIQLLNELANLIWSLSKDLSEEDIMDSVRLGIERATKCNT